MNGKIVVITGALGALGKLVLETALARAARVAGVDHAKAQAAATAERIEIGGVKQCHRRADPGAGGACEGESGARLARN